MYRPGRLAVNIFYMNDKKLWLYYVSPCVIGIVLSLLVMIFGLTQGQWWIFFVFIFGPAFLVCSLATLIIKAVTKGNVLYVWILESIVVAGVFIWTNYRMS
jgi:hypothetical protein